MKYNLFPVVPSDLDFLNPKKVYSVGELGCSRTLLEMSCLGKNPDSIAMGIGPTYGEAWGIAGCYRQWSGSGQIWAVFDERLDKYPIAMLKSCTILINYAVQKQKLRRVSLTVQSGYSKGNRFAHSLGFDFEGKMYAYLPDGEDANLYARLF